jgi:hypothetical protein
MKTITLPLPDWRKECLIALSGFIIANAMNVYAITSFQSPWSEMITSWPWVGAITALIYAIAAFLRIAVWGFRTFFHKQNITGSNP